MMKMFKEDNKMRLKEAFTLQNKILSLYDSVIAMLTPDTFAQTKVHHIYSKANIGNDVIEDLPQDVNRLAGDQPYDFDKLVDLAQSIMEDKQNLTIAIGRAKASCPVNMDAIKQNNVIKQKLISCLNRLDGVKSFEYEDRGQCYGKDNEGKPAVFYYPTKTTKSYNIDKDHSKAILKRLKNEFDESSLQLDELSLSTNVDFVPKYDYDLSLEQIYLEL